MKLSKNEIEKLASKCGMVKMIDPDNTEYWDATTEHLVKFTDQIFKLNPDETFTSYGKKEDW